MEKATVRRAIRILIPFSLILCAPELLPATRGHHDYGIIMVLMAFAYSFPAGLIMLITIIYLVVKLKGMLPPGKNQGRIVLILSTAFFVLSILLLLYWMQWADWHEVMVRAMTGTFMPVLVLSGIAAILALQAKKRDRDHGDNAL